jgi:hypothetical protein
LKRTHWNLAVASKQGQRGRSVLLERTFQYPPWFAENVALTDLFFAFPNFTGRCLRHLQRYQIWDLSLKQFGIPNSKPIQIRSTRCRTFDAYRLGSPESRESREPVSTVYDYCLCKQSAAEADQRTLIRNKGTCQFIPFFGHLPFACPLLAPIH